ncbi:hypothetical protein GCM10023321_01470 [Pseudonocardia eucalypti]|uniref:Uncharacterized protein n=1 Tax=Pseudonocardia eucalypti TaxID=648755 RepID=A0ABP9PDL5_9PSEU|nr:hypothetical protein [Pseudonocardia eucalypti]
MNARRGNTWGRHGFGAAAITGGMIGVSGVGAPARGAGPRGIGMHTDRRVAPSGAQASNPGMHPTTSAATTAMAGVMAEATRRVPQTPPASGGPQHVQGSGPVGAVAARYGVPEYHREAGTSEFRVNEIADQTMRNQPVGPASQFGGGERPQASVGGASVGGPGGTGGFASAQVAAQHRWGMADRSGSGPRHATPEGGSASAESRPQPDPLSDPRPQSGAPNGTPGHTNASPSGPMNALANGPMNGLSNGPANGLPGGPANGLPGGAANGLTNSPRNGLSHGPANGLTGGPGNGLPGGAGNGVLNAPGNGVMSGPVNGPAGFGGGGGSVSDGFLAGSVAALATGFDSYGGREEPAPGGGVPSDGGLPSGASQAGPLSSAGFGTGSMGTASGPTAHGGPTTGGPIAHNGPTMAGSVAHSGPTMAGSTIANRASGAPVSGIGPAGGASANSASANSASAGSASAGGASANSASTGGASAGSRHARPEAPELFGERSARHAAPERADIDGSALGSLDSSTLWGSLSLPSVPPR